MSRLRRRATDDGFTLIELLVVMIIIGILAAIAIPVFTNQRQKAVDASLKGDLRTVAESQELYAHDDRSYLALAKTQAPVLDDQVALSPGNAVAVTLNAAGTAYCIVASNPKTPRSWVYVSSQGGQQPVSVQACPATF